MACLFSLDLRVLPSKNRDVDFHPRENERKRLERGQQLSEVLISWAQTASCVMHCPVRRNRSHELVFPSAYTTARRRDVHLADRLPRDAMT